MTKVNVKDKVVLVTGANRGIGNALVLKLLKSGVAKVYAAVRDVSSLEELKEEYKDRVVPVQLDLTSDNSISAVVNLAKDIDILINNAGVLHGTTMLAENAVNELKDNLEVNVYGLLKLTHQLAPVLKKQTETAVVNFSSMAGLGNMPVIGTYSVSKAAVHSISQGLRAELSKDNVLVSCVYPGPIDTDMIADMEMDKDTPENVAKAIIDGLENGLEEIFPDKMSSQMGVLYLQDPKKIETQFGMFVPAY